MATVPPAACVSPLLYKVGARMAPSPWGVLDRLLLEPGLEIIAISGTSLAR